MKILLTNFHPYYGGGHTTYLLDIYRHLNKNCNLFLACPPTSRLYKFAGEIREENVIGIDFPGKLKELKGIIKNLKKIIGILKKESFDLIHVNGSPDHRMIMYAKILLKSNVPVIRTIHNSLTPRTNFYTKLRRKYFTNKIIVVSDFQKKLMLNNGYREDEMTIIPNGVDTDYFHPIPPDTELREKYKIRSDDMVFVSVAGTALHKGWQLLVEAVSKLDSKLKNKIKIILAGAIPNKSVREKYIEKLNMNEQVIFTGLLPDVRKVISIADVGFDLSYKIETISFACREMMSMGKAVLVSDFAGLPENVDDGINGWLAECLNVDAIYEKVIEIVGNIDKLDRFSVEARKKAGKEFGLKEFIDKTYRCYESTLMSDREVS